MSDHIALCEKAAERLNELGFKQVYQSMKSEARYFHAKGFYGVVRVAFHRRKIKNQTINGMKVTAKITFNKNAPKLSEHAFNKLLQQALGVYFVNRYQGRMNPAGVKTMKTETTFTDDLIKWCEDQAIGFRGNSTFIPEKFDAIYKQLVAAQEMAKALEYAVDKIAPCTHDECKAVDELVKSYAVWREAGGR